MTETSTQLPIVIRDWRDDRIIYQSQTAKTMFECVNEAHVFNTSLAYARLDGARLDGARLDGASLVGARLDGASLVGARLVGARLDGARLDGARLAYARLDGARLDGARLDGASLAYARLDGARLDGARLDGGEILATASLAFSAHGVCGRTLTGIKTKKGIVLMCGCFYGSPEELTAWIAQDEAKYAKSRILAMKTVLMLLKQKKAT